MNDAALERLRRALRGPPIVQCFRFEPSSIEAGLPVTLEWRVVDASTVSIQPGLGEVDAEGSVAIEVAEDAEYELSASGPFGEVRARASVRTRPLRLMAIPIELDAASGYPTRGDAVGPVRAALTVPRRLLGVARVKRRRSEHEGR